MYNYEKAEAGNFGSKSNLTDNEIAALINEDPTTPGVSPAEITGPTSPTIAPPDCRRPIDVHAIHAEAESILCLTSPRKRANVLTDILDGLEVLDFREAANLKGDEQVTQKIQVVLTIKQVLLVARQLNCGLCRKADFIYAYNGEYWQPLEKSQLESFLGEAAETLGVDLITASYHRMKKELFNQFLADAVLPLPEKEGDAVLINLRNGTFQFNDGQYMLRQFTPADFLTYQLGFDYDELAKCPKWDAFLDEVLPERSLQQILAEFIGYVFARHLKLEKTLILYGKGANGKSVVFEVVRALLGRDNVSHVSLESISRDQYYRATLANKLLNYSSEISTRLQSEKFKQLTSGEPIEARLPYGQPMVLEDYARLAFNTNELPKDVEHNEAFFRRFLIIPFSVTVPPERRDPHLAKDLIQSELAGIFNWVLAGLRRLLSQNGFTRSDLVDQTLESFRLESDSVAMFIEEEAYVQSSLSWISLKEFYPHYTSYCAASGFRAVSARTLIQRIETLGFVTHKRSVGKGIYAEKR